MINIFSTIYYITLPNEYRITIDLEVSLQKVIQKSMCTQTLNSELVYKIDMSRYLQIKRKYYI